MAIVNIANFENLSIKREQLDPGTYVVQIQDPYTDKDGVAGQTSFENDKEFFQLDYTVKAGPDQKEADENNSKSPVGKKIHDRVYLTGKAAFRLKQLLIASGILNRADKVSDIARGQNINLDMLLGSGTFQVKLTPNFRKDDAGNTREYRNVEIIV